MSNPNIQASRKLGQFLIPKRRTQHVKRRQKVEQLSEVDCVPTSTHSSQGESQLYIFADNEAVIKMISKSRSPTMRHVSRPQSCYWLVVWQNQFGTQNPNQICWHQKPTRWHSDQRGSFTTWWMESPSVFVQYNEFPDVFLSRLQKFSLRWEIALWLVPCRNEDRTRLRTVAHRQPKQDL